MRSILDWVGFSADIAILSTFFSQKAFTILAVWEALVSTVRNWKHSAAFKVLLSLHLSIRDRAPWTTAEPCLLSCVDMAPQCVAAVINACTHSQCVLDTALRDAIFGWCPIAVIEKLINAGASLENEYGRISIDQLVYYFASGPYEAVDLPLLKFLLEAGAVVDKPSSYGRMHDWSEPNTPIYPTDYVLLNRGRFTNNEDLWSLISLYSDRQQTTVTVPGILEAAQGGQEQLHFYLNARPKPFDNQHRKRVLEVALSEASGRGYADVVQSLLQFGVDPNVRMLPRWNEDIWHPVIRAANSGQFQTLQILVTESNTDIVFLEDRVDKQLDLWTLGNMETLQRGQILRVFSTIKLSTSQRSGIFLRAIRHNYEQGFVSQLLELGLACMDCARYLEGKTSHILVRAIKEGCDVTALEYLVQKDAEVLSGLSADTNRELLEVTISQSGRTRNKILAFLVRNIEGSRSCAQRNVSSLLLRLFQDSWDCQHFSAHDCWEPGCECMITLKWLLDLEVPWKDFREKGFVLNQLMTHTDDKFILGMIHSVADMGTRDGDYALEWAIVLGRLNLAVALIERGVRINDTGPQYGRTALQQACDNGAPLWFIRFLVDRGADVNAPPDSNGVRTALQAACLHGAELSCISFLIDKGADINAPPALENGFTALQYAAGRGLMNIAGLLLDLGADVNALSGFFYDYPDCIFMRAIDLAAKNSRLDMAHFLIAAGARSSRPGCTGLEGAIEFASRQNNFAVASLIQEHANSRSEDPMEVERMWLRANPQACMYNGKIRDTRWVALVKKTEIRRAKKRGYYRGTTRPPMHQ